MVDVLHRAWVAVVAIDGASGAVAQLGEHLLCKQGVVGSIPSSSTKCVVNL